MPSPFLGMDPYLESPPFWGDLQPALITAMKAELKKRISPRYTVWSDVHIWLQEPDAETSQEKPDVFLAATKSEGIDVAPLHAPATTILQATRREGNQYLTIKDVAENRIVTVVELLSPANKEGLDREAYLLKRNEYLATGTNLVEIDLLRSGERLPMGEPTPPPADYYVLVCRAIDFPRTGIWPIGVRERLPEIPIPLLPEDGVVPLPLQDCFDLAYDQGPYDRPVGYSRPPRAPLREEDAAWARSVAEKNRVPE